MNKKEEIFTIGDKTTLGIITNFRLLDNEIIVDFDNKNSILLRSKQLQHIKQPLFTTQDGVDIFEGDEYFTLIIPGFHNKTCVWNILEDITKSNINYDQKGNIKNGRLWFSSKEKAEEYILLNKPCLTINDINSYCNVSLSQLKDLVKSKITNK